jgi:hypothetical protein
MHTLIQVSAWALAAYGWVCLFLGGVALWMVIVRELTGAYAGKGMGGYFRVASWIMPAVCFLMTRGAWFLEARILAR